MIDIHVRYFASVRDIVGTDTATLQIPDGTTVDSFIHLVASRYDSLRPWLPYLRVAVNRVYADGGKVLNGGDEIAVIPPVSGG